MLLSDKVIEKGMTQEVFTVLSPNLQGFKST